MSSIRTIASFAPTIGLSLLLIATGCGGSLRRPISSSARRSRRWRPGLPNWKPSLQQISASSKACATAGRPSPRSLPIAWPGCSPRPASNSADSPAVWTPTARKPAMKASRSTSPRSTTKVSRSRCQELYRRGVRPGRHGIPARGHLGVRCRFGPQEVAGQLPGLQLRPRLPLAGEGSHAR